MGELHDMPMSCDPEMYYCSDYSDYYSMDSWAYYEDYYYYMDDDLYYDDYYYDYYDYYAMAQIYELA